jgi:hypothetical protein
MLIQVIYLENKRCGAVHSSRLDYLIRSGLLFAFRRSDGWVIVGKDPVRETVRTYPASDRRKIEAFSNNSSKANGIEDEFASPIIQDQDFREPEDVYFREIRQCKS